MNKDQFAMLKFAASMLVVATSLTGCAQTVSNYRPISVQISVPEINHEITVSLGEDLLRQGTATSAKGFFIREENNISGAVLSPGFYPQIGEDEDWTYHSYQIGQGLNGMGAIRLGSDGIFTAVSYPQSIRVSKTEQRTCIVTGAIGRAPCDTEHSWAPPSTG